MNYNCLEKRNPLARVKYEVSCDQCMFMEDTTYSWSVKECEELDTPNTCSDSTIDTSNKTKYKLNIKINETNVYKIIRLNVTGTCSMINFLHNGPVLSPSVVTIVQSLIEMV